MILTVGESKKLVKTKKKKKKGKIYVKKTKKKNF